MMQRWDDRFHLAKLQSYHSTKDPHLRRPLSLPRLHPRTRPSSRLRSPSPDSLLQELVALWDKEAVPDAHREAYKAYLNTLSSVLAVKTLRKEVADFQLKRSPIQTTLTAIHLREELLSLFKADHDPAIDLLRKLQSVSVDIVEGISAWRHAFGSQLPFIYAGKNYLIKMKTDIPQDPMLVRALRRSATAVRARAQDAELVIAQEFEPVSQAIPAEISVFPSQNEHILAVIDQASTLSDTYSIAASPMLLSLSYMLLEDLTCELVDFVTPLICVKVCRAYIRAHLLLHSNAIMESIIATTLKAEIRTCAREAYSEESDKAFTSFQQEIVDKVVISEVENGVRQWTNELLADMIATQYLSLVQLRDIVLESIQEERLLNRDILYCTFSSVLDTYLSQEWLEILCEDTLSDEILSSQLDQLPGYILRKVLKEAPDKHLERLAESCYASLLYDYVGDIWCKRLVLETIQEARGETPRDDVFSATPPERRSIRRLTRFRYAA
jgi:hypothetical protein